MVLVRSLRLWIERQIRRWPITFVVGVVILLGILVAFAPVERQEEALAPSDDEAKVYFGSGDSVGQTFIPLPGLQEVRIPIGREVQALGPLILHLRTEYFGNDVRSAVVFVPPPESEHLVFQFEPLDRDFSQLLWVLEAPHGPRRAYWVFREQDVSAFAGGSASLVGRKLSGNFAFTQVGEQRGYQEWGPRISASVQSWEWQSLVLFILAAAIFSILRPWLWRRAWSAGVWIVVLMLATLVLHVWRSQNAPVIIDEGAYLQDALQSSANLLPFRDFLTKGPVYVFLLKLWRALVPDTLMGWRLLSGFSWVAVVGVSAALARRFGLSVAMQVTVAALLAVLPGITSATTPLLLQVVSTLFAVLAMHALLAGAQKNRLKFVTLGALLMAAGYLTRSSTIAVGVAGAVLLLVFAEQRWRALGVYVGVGLVAMAVVSGMAFLLMPAEKVAVMLNIEAAAVGQIQTAQAGELDSVIRWLTKAATALWRGGAVLLSGIVWLPLLLLAHWKSPLRWAGLGLWFITLALAVFHLMDIDYGLPREFLITQAAILIIVFGVPALWFLRSLPARLPSSPSFHWKWISICVVWLAVLTFLYRGWGVFRPSYIVEFLPPAAILAAAALAWGLPQLLRRPVAQAALVGLLAANWWQGLQVGLAYPISGTVTPEAVENMTLLLQREVPAGEEIFTAQPVVTAAARLKIIQGYSHPGWIRAARLGGVPQELRKIYFAEDEEITRWLGHDVRFVVTDERTSEIYFDDFPDRQKILREQFEMIGEVANDLTEEPFRLYRRK